MSSSIAANPMKRIKVGKVVVNIGVGKGGEAVERAKKALTELLEQTAVYTRAKQTIREFGVRLGEPIGLKTTLRGQRSLRALNHLLDAKGRRIPSTSFDEHGNFAFGIREHIDIPGVKYKPDIGIFGMDVCVSLERLGYRVARRRRALSLVGRKHLVSREEAIAYAQEALKMEVV